MKKIFITGTDTSVGKTVTAGLIAKQLAKQFRVAYMKPIQTGSDDDVGSVQNICNKLIELPSYLQNPYKFTLPASPHLASRQENIIIEPLKILQAIDEIEADYRPDYLIIEGAGGILVPLTENYFMRDLLRDINCPCLIVAKCQLGVLNHSLLTYNLLKSSKLKVLGLVLTQVPYEKDEVTLENIKYLKRNINNLYVIPVIVEINDYGSLEILI